MVRSFCSSVLGVPISLGAIQKIIDRASKAINPYLALSAGGSGILGLGDMKSSVISMGDMLFLKSSAIIIFVLLTDPS